MKVEFKIGDLVDFEGSTYSVYGEVESIDEKNGEAKVKFVEANRPRVCEKCGISFLLSKDIMTGEVVHMMTGCGHKHGFIEWKEVISLSKLILAPAK
jgi:hypothetical protein